MKNKSNIATNKQFFMNQYFKLCLDISAILQLNEKYDKENKR